MIRKGCKFVAKAESTERTTILKEESTLTEETTLAEETTMMEEEVTKKTTILKEKSTMTEEEVTEAKEQADLKDDRESVEINQFVRDNIQQGGSFREGGTEITIGKENFVRKTDASEPNLNLNEFLKRVAKNPFMKII
ncbi:UNVERIFIED_CONTAM: hypothetical protein RMT77_017087 [Armadillidium vulgare]